VPAFEVSGMTGSARSRTKARTVSRMSRSFVAEEVVDGEEIGRGQGAGLRRTLGDGHALRVPG